MCERNSSFCKEAEIALYAMRTQDFRWRGRAEDLPRRRLIKVLGQVYYIGRANGVISRLLRIQRGVLILKRRRKPMPACGLPFRG
jgi:hypothetical protein